MRPLMLIQTLVCVLTLCVNLLQADVINEYAKLLASDGAAEDQFAQAVSVSGETAVIGSPYDDDFGRWSGSAYVFQKNGSNWVQVTKLLPSDGDSGDYFGLSVSISGNAIVVGAPKDGDNGNDSGSAYVFEKNGSEWVEVAKLLANDGAELDAFGHSVSISGDTVVVGAKGDDDNGSRSGSAYVFQKSGSYWALKAKLLALGGAEDDFLGRSVSISGNTAVVGANGDDDNGTDSGSVFVFVEPAGGWSGILYENAVLLPNGGAAYDCFGTSVSISGDTVVAGANLDDDNGHESGSAFVFEKPVGGWSGVLNEDAKLLDSGGAAVDYFGASVSIFGDKVVVGAYRDDHGFASDAGTAFVYAKPPEGWSGILYEDVILLASDSAGYDNFGRSVSISNDTVVVGAPRDNDNGSDSGSAYVFEVIILPPSGACCFVDGTCMDLLEEDCVVACGNWHGFDTDCLTFPCPDPYIWTEKFDTYDTMTPLPDQSDWEAWENNPAWGDFYASTDQARSVPSSVEIEGSDDAVHQYSCFTEGIWEYSAYVYVPQEMNDVSYFILLNTYPAETGTPEDWSLQLELDGATGVIADHNGPDELSLINDEWVEIRVTIDLDLDEQSVFYGGEHMLTKSWTAGVAQGGDLNIAAVNLFANGSTSVYYDDLMLTEPSPCLADLTGDNLVNIDDIFAVLGLWGDCPDPCPPYCAGDLTEDCTVNIDDIFAILGLWGPCE